MNTRCFKGFLFLLFYCFCWPVVKLYHWTCRVKFNGPLLDFLSEGKPFLIAWWHQDMLFNFAYLSRWTVDRKVGTIVSQSSDGDIAAYLVERSGVKVFRGSSSRGGGAALRNLSSHLKKTKGIGVIVCDGPRPPARVVKPGIVILARETGLPIFLLRSWGKHQIIFQKSWPKILLVWPFSRVVVNSEGPIIIPENATRKDLEGYRKQVEDGLNLLATQSEKAFH